MPELMIVGNGTVSGLGEKIDSYDRVLRFNHFEITGFEEHVGRRIDIVCCRPNQSIDDTLLSRHAESANELWMNWNLLQCFEEPNFREWVTRFSRTKKIVIPDAIFWGNMLRTHGFGAETEKKATAGFSCVHLAMSLGYSVTIVGFGGTGGHYWKPDHRHSPCHDFAYESLILQGYRDSGLIKVLE